MRRLLLLGLLAAFACGGKVGPDSERVATRTAGSPGDSPPASDPVVDASVAPPPPPFYPAPTDASADPPNDPSCPPAKDPEPTCPPNENDGYRCVYLAPADGSRAPSDGGGHHLCHWHCGCVFLTPESDASWQCVPDLDCDP